MKKKLLLFIPLFTLTACNNEMVNIFTPYVDEALGMATLHMDASGHTTYLMLSRYGVLDYSGAPTKEARIPELHIENSAALIAEPGTPLPDETMVKSTVSGAKFRCWAYYNQDASTIYPDIYTTVPSQSGLMLKAIFDGPEGGGGGGGSDPLEGYGLKFTSGEYMQAVKGDEFDGYTQYVITNATFTSGKSFTLYDFGAQAGWIVPIDPYSFGDSAGTGNETSKYITASDTAWTVRQNFTADVYIKMKFGSDQIYFGLVL